MKKRTKKCVESESVSAEAQRRCDKIDREAEVDLLADPVFQRESRFWKRWDEAKHAADAAAKPFRDARKDLYDERSKDDSWDEESRKEFQQFSRAARDAEKEAMAEHGILTHTPAKTVEEFLARLRSIGFDWAFVLYEHANIPRPTDRLWDEAYGLRANNPFLPELPVKPQSGQDRVVALVRWCESALKQDNGSDVCVWIRVTDGAKILQGLREFRSAGSARAAVTRAANDDEIKTNGKRGRARRIEKQSLVDWALAQQQRARQLEH